MQMNWMWAVALVFSGVAPAWAQYPCPNASDIAPCTCDQTSSNELNMDCSSVRDAGELISIFKNSHFPFKSFNVFTAHECNVEFLSENNFGDVTFQEMYFNNCKIERVDRAAFSGMENTLRRLSFFYNKIVEFPFAAILNRMAKLEMLDLGGNAILELPDLDCYPSMTELHLYRNQISTLQDFAFKNCPSLQKLFLGGNPMTSLETYAFHGLLNLVTLSFRENSLGIIKGGSIVIPSADLELLDFTDSTKLVTIEQCAFVDPPNCDPMFPPPMGVSGNADLLFTNGLIDELDEDIFKSVLDKLYDGRGYLNLTGNPIKCDETMAWVICGEVDYLDTLIGSCCCGGPNFQDLPGLYPC
ncbi:unnamed protein product [Darwinula stevensoni]|uniref:Oplophorus-luciferin 2-monooxygenase non-catalytic subunit n=1 Tax=Darwinula stevensoni TaxID=69355 RepID=A0A7R8WYF6_9CRUS|nr:unnamed protein product [Darwinula stevensoni]CAG0879331.1 unnamed protein product [Darwinula stevensoni]